MKSSFITFLSLFFFLIGAVVAAPAAPESAEIAKRQIEDVDVFLNQARTDVSSTNAAYNTMDPVTTNDVTKYCDAIIVIIKVAIGKCHKLPPGHQFPNIILIAEILCDILCSIAVTLVYLLTKCGIKIHEVEEFMIKDLYGGSGDPLSYSVNIEI
ncbi:hypothetical protein C7212DRAFT_363798 [Tuber magnatum]|uniref:Fungal calcium binding protein domain-containing protein n=1 Tax=Tuber magnatum TaxID=42249 RepID=A0A317SQV9_9PEZI|nr:hypothetical protein C7212DRAFT_363798 [Tuber magnatum]